MTPPPWPTTGKRRNYITLGFRSFPPVSLYLYPCLRLCPSICVSLSSVFMLSLFSSCALLVSMRIPCGCVGSFFDGLAFRTNSFWETCLVRSLLTPPLRRFSHLRQFCVGSVFLLSLIICVCRISFPACVSIHVPWKRPCFRYHG